MDWRKESEMFNQMADYYDKYRPSYPQEIVDIIINTADLHFGSRLLEIGAGSGKATEQFSEYGFEITCIEPGGDLAYIGSEKTKDKNINFVVSRFEDYLAPAEYYDAIFSAQAFHWIAQPEGYRKCAIALKNGGYLAEFWNIDVYRENETDLEFMKFINKYGGWVSILSDKEYMSRSKNISNGIVDSGLFSQPEIFRINWLKKYTAEEYFGFLNTGNVFVQQSDDIKKKCYTDLIKFAEKSYGSIKRQYTCELYLTQKL